MLDDGIMVTTYLDNRHAEPLFYIVMKNFAPAVALFKESIHTTVLSSSEFRQVIALWINRYKNAFTPIFDPLNSKGGFCFFFEKKKNQLCLHKTLSIIITA